MTQASDVSKKVHPPITVGWGGADDDVVVFYCQEAPITVDLMNKEVLRSAMEDPSGHVITVKHGAADYGDCLNIYAISGWHTDKITQKDVPEISHTLEFTPSDGQLFVEKFEHTPDGAVPSGVYIYVRTGKDLKPDNMGDVYTVFFYNENEDKFYYFKSTWGDGYAVVDSIAVSNVKSDPYTPFVRHIKAG